MSNWTLPGDVISPPPSSSDSITLGPGLTLDSQGSILALKAGKLNSSRPGELWVDSRQKRYSPVTGESVLGIIVGRFGEAYKVDIGAAHPATLNYLAFEGATKRNRPNLEIGDLVYARISLAHRDMETELECFNSKSGKSCGFGELKDGFMATVSLKLARDLLLSPNHPVLKGLSQLFPFELAIGWNGRIWLNAAEPLQVILISQMMKSADSTGAEKLSSMVNAFIKSWKDSKVQD